MRFYADVICTYKVEAESKAAASRVAKGIADSLARTGVLGSSGPGGSAKQIKTSARVKDPPRRAA